MKATMCPILCLLLFPLSVYGSPLQQSVGDSSGDPLSECTAPAGTLPFQFEAGGNELRGFIDLPQSSEPAPAIILVHGSGPTDVMTGRSFVPRSILREEGIASVIWDKPGSGCSEGQYRDTPDLDRRVDEVMLALEQLKSRADIDATRIGAMAISQGAWVTPMAAARMTDLAFLIIVSGPGLDMTRQAAYLIRTNLELEGYAADGWRYVTAAGTDVSSGA